MTKELDLFVATMQDVFDFIVTRLIEQGEPSIQSGINSARCMYRYGNLRCAIGHLIPDKAYTPKMEGKNVYSLEYAPLFKWAYAQPSPTRALEFLASMQRAHDGDNEESQMDKEHWLTNTFLPAVRTVAMRHGLNLNVLKERGFEHE